MRAFACLAPAAVAILALAGCNEVVIPGQDTTPIAGNYVVNRVNGNPVPAPGITLTLQPNGSFSGRALCNTYSGRNATKYPGFRVGAFKNGSRTCDRNLQRVELDYFRALTQSTSLTQGAGGISLSGGSVDGRVRIDAVRR